MTLYRHLLLLVALLGIVPSLWAAATCNTSVTATTPSTDFTVNGDGTVTHSRTGLMWQRCAVGQYWSGDSCAGTASKMTWSEALLAGRYFDIPLHNFNVDWRLPNVNELRSIVEAKCVNPSVNESIFPATDASNFWSASAKAGNSDAAWVVSFYTGSAYNNYKSSAHQVRLVRAGQSFDSFYLLAVPDAPTGVNAIAGNASATVSFSPPPNEGGAAITGYTATCGSASANGTASPITVTGLVNGTAVACYVIAINANGNSVQSNYSANVRPLETQVIVFGTAPTVAVGGTGVLSATGGASGNAVTFSSTTLGICTVSGNTVTGISSGNCIIAANQGGNANYATAQATQTIAIAPGSQSISFGTAPTVVVGGTGALIATGGASGNAVTYSSTTLGVCTVSGNTVTGISSGNCTIAANQAGNANYATAQATQTITIAPGSQSISFGTAPTVVVGGTGSLSATGGASGNAVTYSSTTPGVCTVSGNTVTGISAVSCTIAANQAGNANYTAAAQVTQTITIAPGSQSISFGAAPTVVVGGTGTLSATGGASGNAVTYSSTTPGVCTVSGNTVTGITTGSCTIAANQVGNANYTAAAQATQTITIAPVSQSISFGTAPTVEVGGTGVLSATGGASGNVVTYSSTTQGVCTVSGNTVTGISSGSCIIAANQNGNTSYSAAVQVTQTIPIAPGSQSISFGTAPTVVVGGTGSLSATGGASGNAVTFSSTTQGVCTVSGNTVTGISSGSCIIAANQNGNTSYSAAVQVTQTIAIAPGSQSINFGTAPTVVVGGTGTLSATGGASGNAVTYSSTTPGVCTVSGNTVTGISAVSCTIAANQAGNANYTAAAQATQTITIAPGSQSISFGTAPTVVVGGTGSISATVGASGNAVTFSSTTPGICTVSGNTVTGISTGNCTIAANQGGNANYTAAAQATQTITIAPGSQSISFGTAPTVVVGGTGSISATVGASGNAVTFSSTTPGICTVSGSTVTGISTGNCTIAANQAGNANYTAAAQVTQTLSVTAAPVEATAPGVPTNVRPTAGSGWIDFYFDAPQSSGSSAITRYVVSCDSGNGGYNTASPVRVEGLTSGSTYLCWVNAVNDAGNGPASAQVSAKPVDSGNATLSPLSLDFGTLPQGKTATKPVTLDNTGSGALGFTINLSGEDYSYLSMCPKTGQLQSQGSCTLQVTFKPTAPGVRSGVLSVVTDTGTRTVSLSGRGASSRPKLSALTVDGANLSQTFSPDTNGYNALLTNPAATVTVSATVADADATLFVNDAPLAAGASSSPIAIKFGINRVTVRVIAADGVTNGDYTIAIMRMTPGISGGHYHSIALKPDGTLWAWGGNSSGQLGDKTTVDASVPKAIGSGFIAAAAGEVHSVALKTDGSLWTWGGNDVGQLGNNSNLPTNEPRQIEPASFFQAVAVGKTHSLAIKNDGTLWGWGGNYRGQLGGSENKLIYPKYMDTGYKAVAAGLDHTLALKNNGDLYAWGRNDYGQLGIDNTTDARESIRVDSGFMAISAAGHHSVALKSNGDLYAWGYNASYQVGNGVKDNQLKPVKIGTGFSAIAAGFDHNMALMSDGSLWAWGSNGTGQLGDNSTTDSPTPKQIGTGFSAVTAGRGYTVALKGDGSVWALGANRFGQLGDGTLAQRGSEVLVVNDSVNGPLDMDPSKTKDIPADKLPPFWLQVSRSDKVSTSLTYNNEDIDKDGAVYVVAYLDPASPLLAGSPSLAPGKRAARIVTKGGSTLVRAVLTRNGWKQSAVGSPTESVYSGALNSNTKTIAMYDDPKKFDPTLHKGIICVGYVGASAKSAKGLMRSVVTGTDATLNTCPPIELGDTTAPSVPQSITATAAGPGQVKLTWTAANDDVGVVHYHVYRGDTKIATLDNVTSYNDTDPKASTHYSYSVMACDAANNCSGQSTPIETTTPTQPNVVLAKGWNLVGNGGNTPMDVPALFGDANKVVSLWKWVKSGNAPNITSGWAFYTPLEADGGASIAASKGYDTLSVIQSGEGFWVRANEAFSVPMTAPAWILSDVFAPGQSNALTSGWNLVATGEADTPSAFKETVGSFKTLWAWNNSTNGWYFYSPALEASGGLAGYLGKNGYLDFGGLTFQPTTGFWVNMP